MPTDTLTYHTTTTPLPSPLDIKRAADILAPWVHQTPILTSRQLNQIFGCELFFKAEHLQKTGAFKFRGASYALSRLPASARGVVTHSSGNHGAALAAAASARGMSAHVVMPENAVTSKIAAVRSYGGEIHFCAPNQQAREAGMAALVAQNLTPVPPFDHADIIAGQGTAALEMLHHQVDVDVLITPVGGGGLYAGSLLAAQNLTNPPAVIGAEPAGADDTYRSLRCGERVTDHDPHTIADGLRTLVGQRNFAVIQQYSDGVIRVSDASIVEAMRLLWVYLKQVVEPSAATVLAAVAGEPQRFAGQRVGLILSGGNVDLDNLPFNT